MSGMEYRKKVNDLGTSKEWKLEKENDKGKRVMEAGYKEIQKLSFKKKNEARKSNGCLKERKYFGKESGCMFQKNDVGKSKK